MSPDDPIRFDAQWDSSDLGCGELVLGLRAQVNALRPGQVLRVVARDPGAIEDVPAWCQMTGHRLVKTEPPIYFIQRKEE